MISRTFSISQQIQNWKSRGLIKQITNSQKLESILEQKSAVYCGFDPTASSLHIGHLVPLQLLRELAEWGCPIIVLLGTATAIVGDPSFRSQSRQHQNLINVKKNQIIFTRQIKRLLPQAKILNNWTWHRNFSFIDFLKQVGTYFTVNKMLERKSIRKLYQNNFLSYNEFSYILLQAYDFYYLAKNHNCYLQVGGSDQYPNIAFGIDLIKKIDLGLGEKTSGITTKLLNTTATQTKISKTATENKFFLNNMKDNLYDLNLNFDKLTNSQIFLSKKDFSNPKLIKQKTATYLSEWIFGIKATNNLHKTKSILQKMEIQNFSSEMNLSLKNWKLLKKVLGVLLVKKNTLNLKKIMFQTKIASSLSEARRQIEQGSIYLKNQKIKDVFYKIRPDDLINNHLLLRKGKNHYFLITFPT